MYDFYDSNEARLVEMTLAKHMPDISKNSTVPSPVLYDHSLYFLPIFDRTV